MIRKPLQLALAATLFGAVLLTGCQKSLQDDNLLATEQETTFAVTEDDAEADATFNDVGEQALGIDGEIGIGQADFFAGINLNERDIRVLGNENVLDNNNPPPARCFTVTVSPRDPLVFPKTVTIDYGTTGCKGRDGKVRTGKVITVYSKPMMVPGAQAVTEFDNYTVDGVIVKGRHVVKNNSSSSVLIITRLVQNGQLIKPNGNYIKWSAEHTQTQVAGLGTPGFPRDDEWSITGGARGETKRGNDIIEWSRVIVEPLHKAFTCRWIDKGIVKITRNDKEARLNFGNGTCDNLATITVNGVTREIKLK
jgi:hypothetical protein